MKKKLSYDPEEDILYYNEGKKSQDSLDIGNVFVEFSSDNKVVGMEILNASQVISDLTGEEVDPEMLENVKDADIKLVPSGDIVFIVLQIEMQKDRETVRESVPVNVPSSAVAVA